MLSNILPVEPMKSTSVKAPAHRANAQRRAGMMLRKTRTAAVAPMIPAKVPRGAMSG